MAINHEIRRLRKAAGLTQRELALKIGVTPAAVGNYETGLSFPREEVLYRLLDALDCTPNELFGYRSDPASEATPIAAREGSDVQLVLKKRGTASIFDEPDFRCR